MSNKQLLMKSFILGILSLVIIVPTVVDNFYYLRWVVEYLIQYVSLDSAIMVAIALFVVKVIVALIAFSVSVNGIIILRKRWNAFNK